MSNKYLFVLCPPYSGSTVLWKLLSTSPNVSSLLWEGQGRDSVAHIMKKERWNPNYRMPWQYVRRKWEEEYDLSKPILLDKSPAFIIRAQELKEHFDNPYFIIMIRCPYAYCEGAYRRKAGTLVEVAMRWIEMAQYQIQNIRSLDNSIFFSYEQFTDNILDIRDQIINFMPEIESLDISRDFQARSIFGIEPRPIENMNNYKIQQLSSNDIEIINSVLSRHETILSYFGYDLISPAKT